MMAAGGRCRCVLTFGVRVGLASGVKETAESGG